jgi:hypothetical protein
MGLGGVDRGAAGAADSIFDGRSLPTRGANEQGANVGNWTTDAESEKSGAAMPKYCKWLPTGVEPVYSD